jgi:proteasome activator subunit 4
MGKVFAQNIKADTIYIWTSFFNVTTSSSLIGRWTLTNLSQYIFSSKDPRRVWPLVDFLWKQYISMDCNTESSFDAIKVLLPFQSFYETHGWKISSWVDEMLERCWPEICSEHDDVRVKPPFCA